MVEKPVKRPRRYLSYLLRLWQESDGSLYEDAPLWRASLESPRTGEVVGFASLDDLFDFLRGQAPAPR
jgi:hypothetical protein